MSIFNKKKPDREKSYVTYSDGKFLDVNDEFEDAEIEKEKKEFRDYNKKIENEKISVRKIGKSKILIISGIAIIVIPIIFFSSKVSFERINELKQYLNRTEISQEEITNEDTNNNEHLNNNIVNDKDKNNKEDENSLSINKLDYKGLVDLNNKANNQITSLYNFLKKDVELYTNGKESFYITNKILKAKRENSYKIYESFLSNEDIFFKKNLNQLYIQIRDRYANYINTIDDILKDLTTKNAIEIFNKAIKVDNELLLNQYKSLTSYLKQNNVGYVDIKNGIELK